MPAQNTAALVAPEDEVVRQLVARMLAGVPALNLLCGDEPHAFGVPVPTVSLYDVGLALTHLVNSNQHELAETMANNLLEPNDGMDEVVDWHLVRYATRQHTDDECHRELEALRSILTLGSRRPSIHPEVVNNAVTTEKRRSLRYLVQNLVDEDEGPVEDSDADPYYECVCRDDVDMYEMLRSAGFHTRNPLRADEAFGMGLYAALDLSSRPWFQRMLDVMDDKDCTPAVGNDLLARIAHTGLPDRQMQRMRDWVPVFVVREEEDDDDDDE